MVKEIITIPDFVWFYIMLIGAYGNFFAAGRTILSVVTPSIIFVCTLAVTMPPIRNLRDIGVFVGRFVVVTGHFVPLILLMCHQHHIHVGWR